MIIKWSNGDRYLLVETFHTKFLIIEESDGNEIIEYVYSPFRRRKAELTQKGARLTFDDFEEYEKACSLYYPPKWVRKSQLVE